jgi:hypothetical protein
MKNKFILATLLLATTIVFSQKKEKISGNKVVVDVFKTLDGFNKIQVEDNLNITIAQTLDNGYHLKTDENLVDVIRFEVIDSVLRIYSLMNITSSKKLEIDLTFNNLNAITLLNDAELTSTSKLNLPEIQFTASDDAKYDLDITTDTASLFLNNGTKGDLLLKGDNVKMYLNDNAYLKGNIVSDKVEITVNKRADLDLSGDVTHLQLTATGSSDIKAKKLRTTYANLNGSNSADIYINTSKELELYMQGKSDVYVYGNPEIKVSGMNDKSKIIKK